MAALAQLPIDIFVVDDDRVIGHTLGIILRQAGYEVQVYDSPRAAIADLDRKPGLLLTDQVMPEISGCKLAKIATAFNPKTRVLLLSSSLTGEEPEWRELVTIASEARLLAKPQHPNNLISVVRALIGMPARQYQFQRTLHQPAIAPSSLHAILG